jgi:Ser/Thr protein kinase RdoA (MazF antagonist)
MNEPCVDRLAEMIRYHLMIEPMSITEVGELSNINYVYRVETAEQDFYLKVVPEEPKRLPVKLPRERVFSEAEGLRRYREHAGKELLVPEVLFVDGDEMALAMSDVGAGREILFNVLADDFELLAEQGEAFGRALGRIHSATRGHGSPRPLPEEFIIRKVIFDGLLAPGAKQVFPELWDTVSAEMQGHNECLVHADLWSKNLLVAHGQPVAVVDFEGVFYGDPAFDLGTLMAVALLPALDRPLLMTSALDFIGRLSHSWRESCGDPDWADAVMPRAYRATATFLATRGFGPFAYVMSATARQHVKGIARALASAPPRNFEAFMTACTTQGMTS